jgi:hypothetical protein
VLNVRLNNVNTLPRSGLKVKTNVGSYRLTAREIRGRLGTAVTKPRNSRQVLCRELTPFADGGSERSRALRRQGGRVDFIPKGIFGTGVAQFPGISRSQDTGRCGRAAPAQGKVVGSNPSTCPTSIFRYGLLRVAGGSPEVTQEVSTV